jgi:hypothetical protein
MNSAKFLHVSYSFEPHCHCEMAAFLTFEAISSFVVLEIATLPLVARNDTLCN